MSPASLALSLYSRNLIMISSLFRVISYDTLATRYYVAEIKSPHVDNISLNFHVASNLL
jgi:hypothetical protein